MVHACCAGGRKRQPDLPGGGAGGVLRGASSGVPADLEQGATWRRHNGRARRPGRSNHRLARAHAGGVWSHHPGHLSGMALCSLAPAHKTARSQSLGQAVSPAVLPGLASQCSGSGQRSHLPASRSVRTPSIPDTMVSTLVPLKRRLILPASHGLWLHVMALHMLLETMIPRTRAARRLQLRRMLKAEFILKSQNET